jgi:hypothetical protein
MAAASVELKDWPGNFQAVPQHRMPSDPIIIIIDGLWL